MRKTLFLLLTLLFVTLLMPFAAQAQGSGVSGYAWYDVSGDGLFGEDERMLAKVSVTLCRVEADGSKTALDRQVTASDGAYAFTGLAAGNYCLSVTLPETHQFILPQAGGSVMLPAAGRESVSMPFALGDGESKDGMHIGASKSSCYVKAFVFDDESQNGGRSTIEEMMRNVPCALYYEYGGEWVKIAESKTDRDGCASFWDLTPGTYRLSADLPAPYIFGPLGLKINGWYNCVPPCDSGFGYTEPFTVEGGTSLGIGVGAVSTGSLSGSLWYDQNANGLKESDEAPFGGALLRIFSETAGVDRQITSGADGAYAFDLLLAGDYELTVTLPENTMFTLPGGDSLLSEGYSFSATATVSVQNEQHTQVQPIGVMDATTLSVHFYNDLNANGIMDAGEPAFAGAQVEVLIDNEVRATAVSDGNGVACFPVVRGDECDLRAFLPAGQAFTVAGEQNDFTAPAATNDLTLPFTLAHAESTDLYAGVTLPASVSGLLFNDSNLSGILDSDENGLAGFTVQAVSPKGDVLAQTETDENGRYRFNNLLPQAHAVRFLLVNAYVFTAYSDTAAAVENDVIAQTPAYVDTALIALSPGQAVTGVNGGVFRSATVSGSVLLSSGIPGLQAEGGMANVRVELTDLAGVPVSATTTAYTDAEGHFYLKGALPGEYQLKYTLPVNAAFTQPETVEASILSAAFTVSSADDLIFDPVFAIHTGSLAGVIYHDANLNAAYDAGEATLPQLLIQLENTDLGIVYSTYTQGDGAYAFPLLRPGAYAMTMTLPDGYCYTTDACALVPAQTNATASVSFTIGIGEHRIAQNIAAARPVSLGGAVYFDRNNNGVRNEGEEGAQGVTLSFKSVNGVQSYSLLTDESGAYTLPAMVPGTYTLRVSLESDCIPADHNMAALDGGFWTSEVTFTDGEIAAPAYAILRYAQIAGHVWSMDGSLTGVSGRRVILYQDGAALKETVTDESGAYVFTDLKPGQYSISCDLPEGNYKFARTPDTMDKVSLVLGDLSRIENGVGCSDAFTVLMAESKDDCDVGIGAMGSLGDTAWIDLDKDGLQDAGEPNLPGIKIELYQYGELVAETVTDAFGHYMIYDLYPGYYTVRVTMPKEVKPTERVEGHAFVASILTEVESTVAEAAEIIVPSGARNLNCDFGFVLRKDNVYPEAVEQTPKTDWSFGK